MLVNTAGPRVFETLPGGTGSNGQETVRLVRGSHIATERLCQHEKRYFPQGTDCRIIFVIPYEPDLTPISITDKHHPAPSTKPAGTPEEADYLCKFASGYSEITAEQDMNRATSSGPVRRGGPCMMIMQNQPRWQRGIMSCRWVNAVARPCQTSYRKLAESALGKIADVMLTPKGS
ncbi:MAG: hypothetical protein GDA36_10350 [Rhodobacteraceae bacterium]|nr:hypothetical protein [Paracoccaceae bacterium]